MIFQNNAIARKIVVCKFELWVPQLHLTGKGQTLANENFLKPTQQKCLKENLHSSSSQRDANGTWLITPGIKKPKHVLLCSFNKLRNKILIRKTTLTSLTHFDIDGDDSARLDTCRLQYGTNLYPELDYDHDFKIRI